MPDQDDTWFDTANGFAIFVIIMCVLAIAMAAHNGHLS